MELHEIAASNVNVFRSYEYIDGQNKFIGYTAQVDFNVLIDKLDAVEDIIAGLVDADISKMDGVFYETTELKAVRARARRQAVRAAQEKAQLYCDVADVKLGRVIHIEDVNPDQLGGREGHYMSEASIADDGPLRAFDPGSIVVNGAVMMTFEIEHPEE